MNALFLPSFYHLNSPFFDFLCLSPPPPPPRSIYLSAWHLAAAHVQKAMPSHVNSVLCSLCDTFVTSVILSHITHEVFVFCCPVVV